MFGIGKIFNSLVGNNPFPRYQHPYPPPPNFTFIEYLKQCSYNFEDNLANLFKTQYKGRIVQWKGMVTSIGVSEVKFLMNPSDAEFTDSEVTLQVDKSIKNQFVEKKESVFRGRLVSYGLLKNHIVQQVPFDDRQYPVDYNLTYDFFLYYFGAKGQKAASEYFVKYWESHPITFEGTISSFTDYADVSQQGIIPKGLSQKMISNVADFEFKPTDAQYLPVAENVKINIPSKRKNLVAQLKHIPPAVKVVITATCMSRLNPHVFDLTNIVSMQNAPAPVVMSQSGSFPSVPQYVPSSSGMGASQTPYGTGPGAYGSGPAQPLQYTQVPPGGYGVGPPGQPLQYTQAPPGGYGVGPPDQPQQYSSPPPSSYPPPSYPPTATTTTTLSGILPPPTSFPVPSPSTTSSSTNNSVGGSSAGGSPGSAPTGMFPAYPSIPDVVYPPDD